MLCQQLVLFSPSYEYIHTDIHPKNLTHHKKIVLKTSNALSQVITSESFNVNNSMCLFCRFFIKVHRPILKKKNIFEEIITQRLKKY